MTGAPILDTQQSPLKMVERPIAAVLLVLSDSHTLNRNTSLRRAGKLLPVNVCLLEPKLKL